MTLEQASSFLELITYTVVGIIGVWIVFQFYLLKRSGL